LGGVLDTTLCDKVCQWLAAGLQILVMATIELEKRWPHIKVLVIKSSNVKGKGTPYYKITPYKNMI
jgi:hypothetical protein